MALTQVRVVALNVDEGWSRTFQRLSPLRSGMFAQHEGRDLTNGNLAFIEARIGRVMQPTLPLW